MLRRPFRWLVTVIGVIAIAAGVWQLVKLGLGIGDAVKGTQTLPPISLIQKHVVASENALVFVHGFLSNPDDGFTGPSGRSWLDVVRADTRQDPVSGAPPLSTFAVYAIDYRRVFDSRSSVEEAASQVENVILSTPFEDGQTLLQRHNNIWLVAHSLGGVVMKRVLIRMSDARHDRGLRRIKGIFLLGVPSNGAPAAGLANYPAVETISRFYADMDVVRDLDPTGAAGLIDATENAWVTFVERRDGKLYVGCAYEKSPDLRHINWNLVDELYSATRCTGRRSSFPYDHFGLVKVEDQSHDVHLWLRSRIVESWVKVQSLPYFTIDSRGKTLGQVLEDAKKGGSAREPDTGVSDASEIIGFRDESSKDLTNTLGLRMEVYTGPTLANLVEHIARENTCIDVSLDAFHRQITIGVNPSTVECKKVGTEIEKVCSNVPC